LQCKSRWKEELWEQEKKLHGTPIMEELSFIRDTLGIRIDELADAHNEINALDNIRETLLNENEHLRKDLSTLKSDWAADQKELKEVLKENMVLTEQQDLDVAQILISLKNSDDSDDFDGSLDWKNISGDRMAEIKRKEMVIRKKDSKATRLIKIIREKKRIISNLRQIIANETFMRGSLGMVSEVINNEEPVVYHPSELTLLYNSPENLVLPKNLQSTHLGLMDWGAI